MWRHKNNYPKFELDSLKIKCRLAKLSDLFLSVKVNDMVGLDGFFKKVRTIRKESMG